jgi:lia operon protein LiaI
MSERSGKVLLGLILLIVGAMLILDILGIDTGDLLGLLIPGAIMLYGAKRLLQAGSAGKKGWGAFVFVFGLLMLIGKLELLFSCLLAITVMVIGYRLLRRRPSPAARMPDIGERHWAHSMLKDDVLDRWEKEWQTRGQQF